MPRPRCARSPSTARSATPDRSCRPILDLPLGGTSTVEHVATWLSIGQFARATGLTTKALRHYAVFRLLSPDTGDTDTGYRRYTQEQVPDGRLVRRLRNYELPLDEVKR